MKLALLFFWIIILNMATFAQQITPANYKFLQKKEDSLKTVALKIIQGRSAADRFFADSAFTRIFVRALVTKNSFYFPFDSIINISKLYAPDSSFRLYTWQLVINENTVRQHGAIQMKTADGSFKPFVLIDKSDVIANITDTITNNQAWVGAVYYKIIQKKYNNRTFYTLFGYDENSIKSDKKILEVLEFVDGKPVFGNKLFVMEKENTLYPSSAARFVMEFKNEASPRLTYDAEIDAIVFDELISETNEPKKKWTLVPDGEQEGFRWTNGKWIHTKDIFAGKPAQKYIAPNTIRDANGNIIDINLKGNEVEKTSPPLK